MSQHFGVRNVFGYALHAGPEAELFVATADGSEERTLTEPGSLDYNPSSSLRSAPESADNYGIHPSGSRLEQLTNDPDDSRATARGNRTLFSK